MQNADSEQQNLICIGVDGKDDQLTKTYETKEENGIISLRRVAKKEHHLTFTSESGDLTGKYLTHEIISKPNSQALADSTFKVLEEYDSLTSIQAILLDNTAVNTGWKNGLVVKLEKLLGKSIHTIGCALHWNELPLRAILKHFGYSFSSPKQIQHPLQIDISGDIHELDHVKFATLGTVLPKVYN